MFYQPPDYRVYAYVCPVTTLIAVMNVFVFLVNQIVQAPFYVYPGFVNIGFFLAHFSHWELWHLGFNLIGLLYFGPLLERFHSRVGYICLWILLYGGVLLGTWFFLVQPALGFSGLLMGMIGYGAMKYRDDPDLGQMLLVFLGINLAVGLLPGVSFAMHTVGAVVGILVYGVLKFACRLKNK